jgi:hypothetical protein
MWQYSIRQRHGRRASLFVGVKVDEDPRLLLRYPTPLLLAIQVILLHYDAILRSFNFSFFCGDT